MHAVYKCSSTSLRINKLVYEQHCILTIWHYVVIFSDVYNHQIFITHTKIG